MITLTWPTGEIMTLGKLYIRKKRSYWDTGVHEKSWVRAGLLELILGFTSCPG